MKRSAAVRYSTVVSFFRGLYGRVARDLELDPSYISRVARGERQSKAISNAIARELSKGVALISGRAACSRPDEERERGRTTRHS
jgi:hypothetical protein